VQNLKFLVMPALTLAVVVSGPVIRFLYTSLQEALTADYVRTAEGKGLRWREVAVRHALPNGLLPTLNFVGIMTGSLLGGVVIIEWVFGWPGLGALAVNSVTVRDYSVLQGVVLLASATFIAITLAVDVLTFMIDPRLRSRLGVS
jgi:peptide/nickel transport system permease protein